MAEPWGADPTLGVRFETRVLAIPQLVNVEAQILSPCVHDPELGNTRGRVERGQALRILFDRAVADDLHDEIGGSVQTGITIRTFSARGSQSDLPRGQRAPQYDDDVGLYR